MFEMGFSMMALLHAFHSFSAYLDSPPQDIVKGIYLWIYTFIWIFFIYLLMKNVHNFLKKKYGNIPPFPRVDKYYKFTFQAALSYYSWPWLTWFLCFNQSKQFREITPEWIHYSMSSWTDKRRRNNVYYLPEIYWVLYTMQMCMTINRMFTLETTLLLNLVLVLNLCFTIKALNDEGAIIWVSSKYLVFKRRLYARLVVKRRRELLCEIIEDVQNVKIIEEMAGGVDESSPEVVRNIGMEEFYFIVTAAKDFIGMISMHGRVACQKMKIEDMPIP